MNTVLFLCSGNYYRSRFAEIVFNALAARRNLGWRAVSAGLCPDNFALNPGPIAQVVIETARARGFPMVEPPALPRAATEHDIASASLVIALKEGEHRAIIAERFPKVADRVVYWHVHDVDVAPPNEILPKLERDVEALVAELSRAELGR